MWTLSLFTFLTTLPFSLKLFELVNECKLRETVIRLHKNNWTIVSWLTMGIKQLAEQQVKVRYLADTYKDILKLPGLKLGSTVYRAAMLTTYHRPPSDFSKALIAKGQWSNVGPLGAELAFRLSVFTAGELQTPLHPTVLPHQNMFSLLIHIHRHFHQPVTFL